LRISVRKTGWFDGHVENVATLDTDAASPGDAKKARQVEKVVREMRFFDLPNSVGEMVGADMVKYEVDVADGERQHVVVFFADENSFDTAPMRRLVAVLTDRPNRPA
jgi:hypothetical protein